IADGFKDSNIGVRVVLCVSISRPNTNCPSEIPPPIKIEKERYILDTVDGKVFIPKEDGGGAIFLAPTLHEYPTLWLYGTDEAGLQAVSALLPFRTGAGVPDFVIIGKQSWK